MECGSKSDPPEVKPSHSLKTTYLVDGGRYDKMITPRELPCKNITRKPSFSEQKWRRGYQNQISKVLYCATSKNKTPRVNCTCDSSKIKIGRRIYSPKQLNFNSLTSRIEKYLYPSGGFHTVGIINVILKKLTT